MLLINIPGQIDLQIKYLVSDVNGTLAVDGELIPGVKEALNALRSILEIHLLTADTYGRQSIIDKQLNTKAILIKPGDEAKQKADYIRRLGVEYCAALGQGANDEDMIRNAALGICILSREGAYPPTLQAAKIVVTDIITALELLRYPKRITATLRR
jgi:soluble P-type ATPase